MTSALKLETLLLHMECIYVFNMLMRVNSVHLLEQNSGLTL